LRSAPPARGDGGGPGLGARWIADDADFAAVVDRLAEADRYALDTEFHRERSYYPKVALLQLAWEEPDGSQIVLVDPLAVDLRPLARVLEGPGLAVLHAAQQDLEVLRRACGAVPARLFDTQVAAAFLGYSSASLVSLVAGELGHRLPKGDRLTDWLARPLSQDQMRYAAADVAHLLELHDRLVAQLEEAGRLAWVADECEELRQRPNGPGDPRQAWLRIKDHRHLRGPARGVAQAVAAWREQRAAAADQPVRSILPDLGILALAQRPPRTPEDLRKVRGLDDRHARGAFGRELLQVVEEGLALEPAKVNEARSDDVDRALRPAVTLVSAWVSQRARDARIDTAVLATRQDLVSFLNGDPDSRLGRGWRAEVLGDDIRALVEGRAALAFSGKDLVLEPRPGPATPS